MKRGLTITTGVSLLLPIIGIVLLILFLPQNIDALIAFSKAHTIVAPFIVIAWRFLAIVIPPIPGGIVSYAMIPVFGWFWSFIYASIGMQMGMCAAFFLARTFRKRFVHTFIPFQKIEMWENKFRGKQKFFAFLGLRLATAPIFDFVAYVAGLTKIKFSVFFWVNLLALFPDALFYYLGGELYKRSLYLGLLAFVGLGLVFYVIKEKQTEKP